MEGSNRHPLAAIDLFRVRGRGLETVVIFAMGARTNLCDWLPADVLGELVNQLYVGPYSPLCKQNYPVLDLKSTKAPLSCSHSKV